MISYRDAVEQVRHPGVSRCVLNLYRDLNEEYTNADEPQEDKPADQH